MVDNHVKHVDIVIVGGGLTGALLRIALAHQGYRCLLIDTSPGQENIVATKEPRALALSLASVQILISLNVWPLIKAHVTPMHFIHVSEQGAFGATRLKSNGSLPLGYVVEMQRLQEKVNTLLAPEDVLKKANITHFAHEEGRLTFLHDGKSVTVMAKLVVGADGSDSRLRELSGLSAITHHYQQYALVANLTLARSHEHKAYERFTPSGPIALLPMRDKTAALIWTLPAICVERLQELKPGLFLSELQKAFGYRLGRFLEVGKRSVFSLKQVTMPTTVSFPCVFIGNAAQTLHPVAGQGFNLGLRDVATLAQCIVTEGLSSQMLASYQGMRARDQRMVLKATHDMIRLFASQLPGVTTARQLGLIGLDWLPYVKTQLVQYASGLGGWAFAGMTPDLICGIDLPIVPAHQARNKTIWGSEIDTNAGC